MASASVFNMIRYRLSASISGIDENYAAQSLLSSVHFFVCNIKDKWRPNFSIVRETHLAVGKGDTVGYKGGQDFPRYIQQHLFWKLLWID